MLTLLFTEVWLIKNRLFLVGALAPRPMCAKIYEKIVKSVYSYSLFKHKIGFNPFTYRGMAY